MDWNFGGDPRQIAVTLNNAGYILLGTGEFTLATNAWDRVKELGARTSDPAVIQSSLQIQAQELLLAGRLENVLLLGESLKVQGRDSNALLAGQANAANITFRSRMLLGHFRDALEDFDVLINEAGGSEALVNMAAKRTLCIANIEPKKIGLHEFAAMLSLLDCINSEYIAPAQELVILLESAILLSAYNECGSIMNQLSGLSNLMGTQLERISIGRVLGEAAVRPRMGHLRRAVGSEPLEMYLIDDEIVGAMTWPVGVGFTSRGPIGAVGLTIITGAPLPARSRATSSACHLERL